jgi:Protein of unknown function DUF262
LALSVFLDDISIMKKQKISDEDRVKQNLERELKDCLETPISTPNRTFSIGERVEWGNHENTIIVEQYENGKCYKVSNSTGEHIQPWYNLYHYRSPDQIKDIKQYCYRERINMHFMQQDIHGLFTLWYHFGVETEIDYQRDYVWELSDKQALIQSIFNNIEIGKFVFIFRGYTEKKTYEVLDGKQRLEALTSFYEDRFQWNGKYFSELHPRDKNHFMSYSITVAESRDKMSDTEKYLYFLKLNTNGKPQSEEHLAHVKDLYEKSLS